jgi:hypothetical protein
VIGGLAGGRGVLGWSRVCRVEYKVKGFSLEMVRGDVVDRSGWGWNEFVIMEEHGYSYVLLASLSYMLEI